MEHKELPLGFGMALAQRPEAMKRFSNLPEAERAEILQRVHTVSSRSEMRELVRGLEPL